MRDEEASTKSARSAIHPKEDYYNLANLFPKHTGLPFVIWISVRGNSKHDVRVKVSPSANVQKDGLISVAIRPTVRVISGTLSADNLALLTAWIELNRATLILYWNNEIDIVDALALLRPLA